jgi:GAF domain-containing protein
VPDVQAFAGHIVCDARARSEIVVPVFDGEAELLGVLDIDSEELDAFSDVDAHGLERMLGWFTRCTRPATAGS